MAKGSRNELGLKHAKQAPKGEKERSTTHHVKTREPKTLTKKRGQDYYLVSPEGKTADPTTTTKQTTSERVVAQTDVCADKRTTTSESKDEKNPP